MTNEKIIRIVFAFSDFLNAWNLFAFNLSEIL